MKQKKVIDELREMIINQLEQAYEFKSQPEEVLRSSPSEKAWNVYQCIEHLNRYADFYSRSIREQLKRSKKAQGNYQEEEFKAGYWGKKFCDGMLPDDRAKISKMNTFKSKNPALDEAGPESLDEFLSYQEKWLKVLDETKAFDLNKNKCKLTIPLIKMNLGSTLRFVIYHQERHMIQAIKAVGKKL